MTYVRKVAGVASCDLEPNVLKTLQSVAVARAIALRGELELAAEVGVTVNRLTLTQNSMADANGAGGPAPDGPAEGDRHLPDRRR